MPISKTLLASFRETSFYHVICKSIDGKKLVLNDDNRKYFLKRYNEFSLNFFDTYAFCLLDNHFHTLIKTKSELDIVGFLQTTGAPLLTPTHKRFIAEECDFHELIEQQFNRLFIAYSLAFNKANHIKGHLFNRPFKRIEVKDNSHLTQLYIYIHANTAKHKLPGNFTTYKWSSFQAIISGKPTNIKRDEVLEWFGGRERFIERHQQMSQFYFDHPLSGE